MSKQKSDSSLTLDLSEFIDILLREDFSYPVSHKQGEILEALSKDMLLIHVQWTTFEGSKLPRPVVWRYKYWTDSSERWQKQKEESERRRIEKFIFDSNVKLVTKACVRFLNFDEQVAINTALTLVKQNRTGALNYLKVKLITKIEDCE